MALIAEFLLVRKAGFQLALRAELLLVQLAEFLLVLHPDLSVQLAWLTRRRGWMRRRLMSSPRGKRRTTFMVFFILP